MSYWTVAEIQLFVARIDDEALLLLVENHDASPKRDEYSQLDSSNARRER
jgi:hypothetical protein